MQPTYSQNGISFYAGHVVDVWQALAAQGVRVQCVVTSPPYWNLRDYGHPDQIGQEPTVDGYVRNVVAAVQAVRLAMRPDSTLWLNLADTFGPDKSLVGVPWRVVFALKDAGWVLRNEIQWVKTAPMPESMQDRFTRAHEQVFVFSQRPRYFMDMAAIAEPQAESSERRQGIQHKPNGRALIQPNEHGAAGTQLHRGDYFTGTRNPRDVWTLGEPLARLRDDLSPEQRATLGPLGSIAVIVRARDIPPDLLEYFEPVSGQQAKDVLTLGPDPYDQAHFATFPREIPRRAILAGTSAAGACPACGTAWRRVVARESYRTDNGPPLTRKREILQPGNTSQFRPDHDIRGGIYSRSETIGWQPGCTCNAGAPVPCVAADPFLGSGTTAEVAYTLGRGCIGGDLNADYLQLAIQRVQAATPWYARDAAPTVEHELGPLFAGVA